MKKNLKKIIAVASIAATATAVTTPIVISNITTVEAAPVNQWKNVNGKWYFYKNGKKTTGWKNFTKADGEKTNHWSYFGKDGVLRTGWKYLNKADGEKTPHWSYFGSNGWLRTGWQTMGTKANPDGNAKVHVSYFGSNGWLRIGWVKLGKGTAEPDGNSAVHWSYFGDNGWLRTGWQQMGKGTGNSYGENTAKHWSYFGTNGWLRTGLITLAKGTSNPDGDQPKHQSYFGGNGWLVISKNFSIVNGNVTNNYKADSRGWVTFVNKTVNATGVSVSKTNLSIEAGKTAILTATVKPANTTNKKVTWASSNTNVATVLGGKITAKTAGTTTITAKTANGKTATCKVTVTKKQASSGGNNSGSNTNVAITGISLSYNGKDTYTADFKDGYADKKIKLTANISPNNATNKTLTWSSDDTKGATVASDGTVTIKWDYVPRIIKITAKSTSNGKTATFTIYTKDSAVPWYYL